jgi:calpain-5
MACAINPHSKAEMEEQLSCGLIKGHAYGITKIMNIKIKENKVLRFLGNREILHMVRLRNPWGKKEYNGPWSDGSDDWNRLPNSEREKIGLNFEDDGEFWMEFKDFLSYFDEISICRIINTSLLSIRKTWSESTCSGKWSLPNRAGGCVNNIDKFCDNPQFLFDIDHDDEKDEVLINLDQMNMRSLGKDNLTIGFYIMKVEDNRKYRIHQVKDRTASSVYINTRSVFLREKLERGRYICIPSTFQSNIEGQFLLRIYSDNNNDLRELVKDCPTPFMPKLNPFAKYPESVASVIVKSASNLKAPTDLDADLDTYVFILNENKNVKGHTVKKSSHPEWNTSAIFYRYKPKEPIIIQVKIKILFIPRCFF